MGSRGSVLSTGARKGCFQDKNCDHFVSAFDFIESTSMWINVYVSQEASGTDLLFTDAIFYLSKNPPKNPPDFDKTRRTIDVVKHVYGKGVVNLTAQGSPELIQTSEYQENLAEDILSMENKGWFSPDRSSSNTTVVIGSRNMTKYSFRSKYDFSFRSMEAFNARNDTIYPVLMVIERLYQIGSQGPQIIDEFATVITTGSAYMIFSAENPELLVLKHYDMKGNQRERPGILRTTTSTPTDNNTEDTESTSIQGKPDQSMSGIVTAILVVVLIILVLVIVMSVLVVMMKKSKGSAKLATKAYERDVRSEMTSGVSYADQAFDQRSMLTTA